MMKKVLTCCYCGTRSALVIRDHGHHELSCQTCGAPLDHMKQMPGTSKKAPKKTTGYRGEAAYKKKKKEAKKKKSFYRKAFEEVFDMVEDIFD